MKKVIRAALIILAGAFLLASVSGQTVINGNLRPFPSADFRIVINQALLNEFRGETVAEGKTNASGEFTASFKLAGEKKVAFFIADRFFRLWLMPDTTLTIDETNSGEFKFVGPAAGENSFLYHSGIMDPMATKTTGASERFEPGKQLEYLDGIERKRRAAFKSELAGKSVSKQFACFYEGETMYFSMLNKNQYALQNIYGPNKITPEDIPSNYYDFWKRFKLLDDACDSDSYMSSLQDYIGYLTAKTLNIFNKIADKEKYFATEFQILDSVLAASPQTKERLEADRLLFLIKYYDLPRLVESQFKNYKNEFPSSQYAALIDKKWDQKTRSSLTSPTFSLKDAKGGLFDIKSLRGKVVYIDFWGSWCKACMSQMPSSAKLQSRFKGKDVAFLFINFYDSKRLWLNTIRAKKLKGIHIKTEKENLPFFNKTFGVDQGFPRYALLDKDGKLVTQSAPHPNDEDAAALIERYLK